MNRVSTPSLFAEFAKPDLGTKPPKARITPCTVAQAKRHVAEWHRHLPKIQGGLFAAGLSIGDEVVAVAVAGNPARVWQGTGRFVISRVAVSPNVDTQVNACSMLYGAICRAGKALGYREAWTYTLEHEPGTSLRAAGFTLVGISKGGGSHGSKNRKRAPAVCSGPKNRWCRVLRKGP